MLNAELQKVDEILLQIAQQLNLLELVSPVNLQSEKEEFFASKNYNPQFEYKISLRKFVLIEERLKELEIDDSTWQGVLLNEVKEKFLIDCNFAKQIGRDSVKFTEANQKKYYSVSDLHDGEILILAEKEISSAKSTKISKKYTAERVQKIFRSFLLSKQIPWSVVIDRELIPLLSVNYFQEIIRINPKIELSQIELERMLVHEVETHLYRYLNGKNLFQMASVGLKNYEKTEEGLATYNESLLFPEDKTFLKRFYLRYKAVLFGEKNSFRKLYEYLIDEFGFDDEEAWRTTLRIKRGMSDTSQVGAFLKDKIYLQGFFAVSNLPFVKIQKLYKGKFSLEHLDSKQFNLNDDKLISSAKYLPSCYVKSAFSIPT